MSHDTPESTARDGAQVDDVVAAPLDRDAMVGLMGRYRRARQELEEAEANGAAYVAQVRAAAPYDAKLNDSRAKKLALARATEVGEVLPGTDTQKRETLVVKLA